MSTPSRVLIVSLLLSSTACYQGELGYLEFALKHPRWYQILFTAPEQLGMGKLPDDIEAMGAHEEAPSDAISVV